MRVYHMYHSGAPCDERHILLECPALGDLRKSVCPIDCRILRHQKTKSFACQNVWADDQPLVSKYIACLDGSEVH